MIFMGEKKDFLPKIMIGGKKVDLIFVIGFVLVLTGFFMYYLGGGQKQIDGANEFEKKIADRIKASEGVSSKEEAITSMSSISQELENARASVSKINESLEGQGNPSNGPQSGLVVESSAVFGLGLVLVGLIIIVFEFFSKSKQS